MARNKFPSWRNTNGWEEQLSRIVYPIQHKKRFKDGYRLSKLERLNIEVEHKINLSDRNLYSKRPTRGRIKHLTQQVNRLRDNLWKEVKRHEHDAVPTP